MEENINKKFKSKKNTCIMCEDDKIKALLTKIMKGSQFVRKSMIDKMNRITHIYKMFTKMNRPESPPYACVIGVI